MEEPLSERLCLEAPKESENTDNAIREDEGENSSTKSESDCDSYNKEEKRRTFLEDGFD